ncbi:hypothetical protein NDU88_012422 [Pleurodeles waltl]|uniref:Uncharacterized protein n=1 Tax=Pleurodeles waltl TaxID=8319 RepID=A0AAV7R3T3_PLEWA|nr:hypothetical protein NDU88_012422 [Pleurodeles waltl]
MELSWLGLGGISLASLQLLGQSIGLRAVGSAMLKQLQQERFQFLENIALDHVASPVPKCLKSKLTIEPLLPKHKSTMESPGA